MAGPLVSLRQGRRNSGCDASQGEPKRLAKDQPNNVMAARAERQSNADLGGPASDRMRLPAIKTYAGEPERESAEETGERREQPLLPERLFGLSHQRVRAEDDFPAHFWASGLDRPRRPRLEPFCGSRHQVRGVDALSLRTVD